LAEGLARAFAPNCGARRGESVTCPPHVRTHLAVLGLRWPCTVEQVQQAYRALAKQYHPDRNSGESGVFVRVQTAYDALVAWMRLRR
jgi:hypothetical protein